MHQLNSMEWWEWILIAVGVLMAYDLFVLEPRRLGYGAFWRKR